MKNQIKKDIVSAMKRKDTVARDILKVLKGEIERQEDANNSLSDAEIVKLVKKLIEGIKETNSDNGEVIILEEYLPTQMDKGQITIIVTEFIKVNNLSSPREMGMVMGYFKKNFEGTYDGKELSIITKNLLN